MSYIIIKDIIEYKNKEYQLSCSHVNDMTVYEIMIFPIENEMISGNEVYTFRTLSVDKAMTEYHKILNNTSLYVSEEAINKYLKSKKEDFIETDLQKFKDFFDKMNIEYKIEIYKNGKMGLIIDDKHVHYCWGNSVEIKFKIDDESFIEFETWGE